jgi:hypothetical protein
MPGSRRRDAVRHREQNPAFSCPAGATFSRRSPRKSVATFRRKIRFSRELVPNGVGVREKRREGVGKGADWWFKGMRYFLQGRMIEGRREDAESEEREEREIVWRKTIQRFAAR